MSPSVIIPETFATFGELLRFLRRQARLTQSELALSVGYSDAQISRMEKDERIPDSFMVTALLVPALGIEERSEWVERLVDLAEAAHSADAVQKRARLSDSEIALPPHNLPVQLTSFVGREKEIDQLRTLIGAHRLVTILGPGGMGKTRLSFEVAGELLTSFTGGIWLAELAPVSDPAFVPFSLANALGLREAKSPDSSMQELIIEYLRPRKALVLLDNCEHLIEAVSALADLLLKECPQVSILATSREALRLKGETVYRLLPLIPPQASSDTGTVMKSESVRLFVERAQDAAPGFTVIPEDVAAIARICLRLDGIPLALELAAVRVKMMTIEEIAQRLEDRFLLLTGGARTSLPRQRTLRASMDWSYNLLSTGEKTLLARLSVFAGGWTLDAMETVCTGEELAAPEILDGATDLMDKSLISAYKSGAGTRYRILETIRQYAAEKLVEAGEEHKLKDRHLDYYVRLAEAAEPQLHEAEQLTWFNRLETEKDNLRSAIEWSIRTDQIEKGLRLGAALFIYWDNKGYWTEGYERLGSLLKRRKDGDSLVHARARVAAGSLASACGYSTEMRPLFEEGIQILRSLGNEGRHFLGFALAEYSKAFIDRDVRQGRSLAEAAIQASRAANDTVGLAHSLYCFGMMTRRVSDYEAARAAEEESLALFQKLGNRSYEALLMSNLAWTFYFQGDLRQAGEYFDRSMEIAREIGDRYSETNSIPGRGDVYRRAGEFEEAETLLLQGLAFHRQIGSAHQGLVNHLNFLGLLELSRGSFLKAGEYLREGVLAAGRGNLLHFLRFVVDSMGYLVSLKDPRRAALLFGGAVMLREQLGTPLYPVEKDEYEKYVSLARAQMDETDWKSAWETGRSLTVEQLIQLASTVE